MAKGASRAVLLGKRLRLRDLHLLLAIAEHGSMAKAANALGLSQPAVSEMVANLEHLVGAPLFDRSTRGVEPTLQGEALLRRSRNIFDELAQGVRDIEFISDPTVGELRIGCPESLASSILPVVLDRFWQKYPGVLVRAVPGSGSVLDLPSLRSRDIDLFVGLTQFASGDQEFHVETLFDDSPVVVVGLNHPLARRRDIDLAQLADHPWLLTGPHSRNYKLVESIFRARDLKMPRIVLDSFSIHLRTNLVANSPYVTMLPHSVLRFNESRYGLKFLPVEIPAGPWSVGIVTLRNRTPTPIVQVFVEHLREFVTSQPELRVREGKKAPTPPRRAAAGRRSSARPSAPT